MAIATGFISEVVQRPWKNKVFYSLRLVNDSNLYGFGPTNPMARNGDEAMFEWSMNDKGYPTADATTLKIKKGTTHTVTGATVRASSAMGKDDYWSRKETRDVENDKLRAVGASRNTAIAWVELLLKAEALKLPAKASDREAALNALLDETTARFMGVEAEKAATDGGSDIPVTPAPDGDGEWN